jgi:hypothetical protein
MAERPHPDLDRVREALTERDDAVPEPEPEPEAPADDEQEKDGET